MVLPERGKGVFRTGNAARQAGWIMRDGGAFAGLVCDTRMAGDTVGFRGAPYIVLKAYRQIRGACFIAHLQAVRGQMRRFGHRCG
jgi:hypothetical protein